MGIILKGKRVVLRPLSLTDAPRFCQWLKDSEVTKFLAIYDVAPPTLKEEREWIRKVNKAEGRQIRFAIDTIDGQHIGSTVLSKISSVHKRAMFGIFIGDKKYWGQGYGTEACRLIVEYGFRKLKLHRIELELIAYNIRAQKSYQKVGFRVEGKLRDHYFRGGDWHDQIVMGLLREEYLRKNKKI